MFPYNRLVEKLWGHCGEINIETADIMPNGYENWLLWDKTLKEAGVLGRTGDVELLKASENNLTWIRIIGRKK